MGNAFLNKIISKIWKSDNANEEHQDGIMDRYGVDEADFHDNPIYEQEAAPIVQDEGYAVMNIGGLPTRDSVVRMAGGLDEDKLEKHKNFQLALEQLGQYQQIMQEEQRVKLNYERARRYGLKFGLYSEVELNKDKENSIDQAWEYMTNFIYYADKAVRDSRGLFARRSSTVRKLTPVFANMLMRAYSVLPKLSHLESAIAPYLIERDMGEEKVDIEKGYTLDAVINSRAVGGRSGGLAMTGFENNGAIDFSPKEIMKIVRSSRKKVKNELDEDDQAIIERQRETAQNDLSDAEEKLQRAEELSKQPDIDKRHKAMLIKVREEERKLRKQYELKKLNVSENKGMADMQRLRDEKTKQARMALIIPKMPKKCVQEEYSKASPEEQRQQAKKITDQYIASLKILITALEDVEESHEFSEETEREGVHDRQAEYFRLIRLFSRLIMNKEKLQKVIFSGWKDEEQDSDMKALHEYQGLTLSEAVVQINAGAMQLSQFEKLQDKNEVSLKEGEDYKIGGGETSIAIIDRVNKQVLRAPKIKGQYYDEEQQKKQLNGIRDEAAGKVSQLLGLNVCAQAQAKGFVASEGGKETAVFGGSVMELAKGETLADTNKGGTLNLLLKADDEKKLPESRKGRTNINIMENGRLIGDMMKMNVLDYIIWHEDRNAGNFLINLDAEENESMVTAIDNDMILGSSNDGDYGNKSAAHVLNSLNNKMPADFGITLQSGFPMMTQEVKDILNNLQLNKLNELLMPYADRVSRLAALHRAEELKKWAEKVPVCDLTSKEGIKKYIKAVGYNCAKDWCSGMCVGASGALDNTNVRKLRSLLMDMILQYSYNIQQEASWASSHKEILKALNMMGLTKDEARKMLQENISSSMVRDEKVSEEMFQRLSISKDLEEYEWDESYVL